MVEERGREKKREEAARGWGEESGNEIGTNRLSLFFFLCFFWGRGVPHMSKREEEFFA